MYAETPVLLTGNPPTRVPEARQAAEWRVLLAQSADASAHGMLTRLSKTLRLARAPHQAVTDTAPFPCLAPPPAETAAP
jgi:hypothetical protein